MRLFKTLLVTAIVTALCAVPGIASARGHHHSASAAKFQRWEKKFHLHGKAAAANADPDHDGLSNMAEFRDGTNPTKADTDGDGVNDGTEVADGSNPTQSNSSDVAGTITSFQNGVLTIQPSAQGSSPISGTVNDQTEIECGGNQGDNSQGDGQGEDGQQQPSAQMSEDGSGDNSGSGDSSSGSGDNTGQTTQPGTTPGDDDQGDAGDQGDNSQGSSSCTTANLTPGTQVHEAQMVLASDGSTIFTKIELIPAA